MKTYPADTTILEECYWQTPGIVRSREDSRRTAAQATAKVFAAQAWPEDDAFGCGY